MLAITMVDKFERLQVLSDQTTTLDGMRATTADGRKLVGIVFTGVVEVEEDTGKVKAVANLPPTELVHLVSKHYSTPNLTEEGRLSPEAQRIFLSGRLFDYNHNRLYHYRGPIYEAVAFVVMMREDLDAHKAGQEGSRGSS